jgi:hypothetical protein
LSVYRSHPRGPCQSVTGTFLSHAAIICLVGGVLPEQDDEWAENALYRRYGPGNPRRLPKGQKGTEANESSVTIDAIDAIDA